MVDAARRLKCFLEQANTPCARWAASFGAPTSGRWPANALPTRPGFRPSTFRTSLVVLSNILSSLARAGVLTSAPGIGGGFARERSPSDVALDEILKPFESILGPSRPCPFGNEVWSDDDPCAGHESWKHVKEVYAQFLHDSTIHDVSIKHGVGIGSTKRKR